MEGQGLVTPSELLQWLDTIQDCVNAAEGPIADVPYTTKYQRRRRSEIQELKAEAQNLQEQLVSLLQERHGKEALVNYQVVQKKWHTKAVIEFQERLRAEASNRRMKTALSKHIRLLDSISKVIKRRHALEELEFVRQLQPSADCQRLRIDFGDSIFAQISDKLMRLQAPALPALDDGISTTFRSQFKPLGLRGGCFESMARMPLACTVQQAENIVWGYVLSTANRARAREAFNFVRIRSNDSNTLNEIPFSVTTVVQDGLGSPTPVEGVGSFRKFKEGNQFIQVATMAWFLPDEHLQFEDEYWTVVSPSPTDPENSSVIQTHYVLRCSSFITEPVKRTSDAALHSIGQRARRYIQLRHDAYLEHANPVFLV